jgi:hypothetical protein
MEVLTLDPHALLRDAGGFTVATNAQPGVRRTQYRLSCGPMGLIPQPAAGASALVYCSGRLVDIQSIPVSWLAPADAHLPVYAYGA